MKRAQRPVLASEYRSASLVCALDGTGSVASNLFRCQSPVGGPKGEREGFVTLASGKAGDNESLRIRADARLVAANLKAGESAEYRLDSGRRAYLVPATGAIEINGLRAVFSRNPNYSALP